MKPIIAFCFVVAVGCAGPSGPSAELLIDIGPIPLGAGEETDTICFSVTLDNDEPLYVNAVEMNAGNGVHHSNWLFVPEGTYAGPDGSWQCAARNFNTAVAAISGGVLFAQSTQTTYELQQFQPGAVVVIPPRYALVGNLHLLNASDQPIDVSTALTIRTIDDSEVTARLAPIYMQYLPLTIPPQRTSRFTSTCDYDSVHQDELGRPLDIELHYLLPHYHGLGRGMRLEIVGGARDGEVVYENDTLVGEAWGKTLDQPVSLAGAQGLRFSCLFENPTAEEVGWGIGTQEMCIMVGFAQSELIWGGGVMTAADHQLVDDTGAVAEYQGACTVLTAPLRQ